MRSFLRSALLATVLSSCASSGKVTEARICLEIPFVDGQEGACAWTVSHKKELIPADKWKSLRPTMLMIDAASWTNIKLDWLKACRMAGPDCNIAVKSVDDVIQALDKILKQVIPVNP